MFSAKKYLLRFAKRFWLASFAKRRSEHKSVFTTNNTRPNQKINRLNQRALNFTKDLTTATLQCTVRPYFYSFSQNHNRSTKTKTKSHKTTPTNNHDKQSIQSFNQKHAQNKHDMQSTAIYNHIYLSQNESGNTITTNNHSIKHYQKQQSFQSAAKTTTTINPRIRQTKTPSKQTQ